MPAGGTPRVHQRDVLRTGGHYHDLSAIGVSSSYTDTSVLPSVSQASLARATIHADLEITASERYLQ